MLHLANSHIALGNYSLEDIDNTGENEPVIEQGSSKPKNCTTTTVSNSGTPTPSTSISSLSKPTANTSNDSSTNGTLTTSSGAGERACLAELGDRLGEGDNGSQKVAMPTWRHNAPYRCGHCHQVSNWKHVIQVYNCLSSFLYSTALTSLVLFVVTNQSEVFVLPVWVLC